jgi:hypothetical protein
MRVGRDLDQAGPALDADAHGAFRPTDNDEHGHSAQQLLPADLASLLGLGVEPFDVPSPLVCRALLLFLHLQADAVV